MVCTKKPWAPKLQAAFANYHSEGFNFTKTLHNDTYAAIDSATKSNLSNKYVFITGASKGIGRATAISYAKAGASAIAVGARSDLKSLEQDMKKAARDAGKEEPNILSLKVDVCDRETIESAAKEIEQKFGRLDILVNNAYVSIVGSAVIGKEYNRIHSGYLESFVPIADSDPDEWWYTWTVNMRGPYLVTRSFLPLLLKGGDKQIINLSSIGAHATRYGASAYQTSKLAILRFTEFIMSEYGEKGVLAFAVHPGGVMTGMAARMPSSTHHRQFIGSSLLRTRPCSLTCSSVD